jgi:hypothetical protein
VDFEEMFSPLGRIESIRMFLDFSCYKNFKFYQMDLNLTFLNGDLEEDVYVEQPNDFFLTEKNDYVCRLKKDMYGIKQAPRSWYYILDR